MAIINVRAALRAAEAGSTQRSLPSKAVSADAIEGQSTVVNDNSVTAGDVDGIATNW